MKVDILVQEYDLTFQSFPKKFLIGPATWTFSQISLANNSEGVIFTVKKFWLMMEFDVNVSTVSVGVSAAHLS